MAPLLVGLLEQARRDLLESLPFRGRLEAIFQILVGDQRQQYGLELRCLNALAVASGFVASDGRPEDLSHAQVLGRWEVLVHHPMEMGRKSSRRQPA